MTGLLLNLRGIYNKPISATAPAFDPATLFANGEDGFWYDPSDTSTMWATTTATIQTVAASAGVTATAGNLVARIDDKSGNAIHATQATLADRPVLRQSGGLYYLEFDGAGDNLTTSSVSNGALPGIGITVGMEHLSTNTRDDTIVSFSPGAAGGFLLQYFLAQSNVYRFTVNNFTGGSVGTVDTQSAPPPSTRIITAETDLTIPEVSIDLDGTLEGTATPASTGLLTKSAPYTIGADLIADIYQIILVREKYTTSEKTDVENYVAAKTGVTL